jgi:hypothetical protein
MKRLQAIDYILIIEGVVLAIMLVALVTRPTPPCYESLDQYPNLPDHGNFGQPILTEHNCVAGQVPTNWRDFEPKGN